MTRKSMEIDENLLFSPKLISSLNDLISHTAVLDGRSLSRLRWSDECSQFLWQSDEKVSVEAAWLQANPLKSSSRCCRLLRLGMQYTIYNCRRAKIICCLDCLIRCKGRRFVLEKHEGLSCEGSRVDTGTRSTRDGPMLVVRDPAGSTGDGPILVVRGPTGSKGQYGRVRVGVNGTAGYFSSAAGPAFHRRTKIRCPQYNMLEMPCPIVSIHTLDRFCD